MGILLAVTVAILDGFNNVFLKRGTIKLNIITITWAWQFFAFLVLLPILLFAGIPQIGTSFWWSAPLKIILYTFSLLLYTAALQKTDISLVIPMLAVSPIITMVISYFLNNDTPSFFGIIGVILIATGVYVLHSSKNRKGLLKPFFVIFANRGAFFMLLVAFLWGITGSLDKTATISSSPIFYSTFVAFIVSLVLTPAVFKQDQSEFSEIFTKSSLKIIIPIGIISAAMELFQMMAVSLTLAAYAFAVKRSSIVISSIFGFVFFQEKIRERAVPVAIIFIGILLIVLF